MARVSPSTVGPSAPGVLRSGKFDSAFEGGMAPKTIAIKCHATKAITRRRLVATEATGRSDFAMRRGSSLYKQRSARERPSRFSRPLMGSEQLSGDDVRGRPRQPDPDQAS